jgi:hypothetical protein
VKRVVSVPSAEIELASSVSASVSSLVFELMRSSVTTSPETRPSILRDGKDEPSTVGKLTTAGG